LYTWTFDKLLRPLMALMGALDCDSRGVVDVHKPHHDTLLKGLVWMQSVANIK